MAALSLLCTILLLVLALLVVLRAPDLITWRLTIISTEYGNWLSIAALFLLFINPLNSFQALILGVCNTISCLLFLIPARSASRLAKPLKEALASAFPIKPTTPDRSHPFSWPKLWLPAFPPRKKTEFFPVTAKQGHSLCFDFYRPDKSTAKPCIIVLHGGGWSSGDEKQLPDLNHYLRSEGYPVAAVRYRLSPGSKWPAQKEDVLSVLDHLKAEHAVLGIIPDSFVLLGRSAGGQIALATAYGESRPEIKGCISYHAPTDMIFTYDLSSDDDILRSRSMMLDFLGGTPSQQTDRYYNASPLMLVSEKSVPTLLVHGTRDELVFYKQSRRLMEALKEKKRPALLLEMPWATHAFDFHWNGPANQLTLHAVKHFLNHLQVQTTSDSAVFTAP